MSTLYVSHPSSLEHDTGPGHPERADRIRVLDRAFESEIFQMLHRELAPELDYEALLRVHPADYIERIKAATPTTGLIEIAEDVVMSPGTWEAIGMTYPSTNALSVDSYGRTNQK